MKSFRTTTAPPVVDPIRALLDLEAQIAALVGSLDVEMLGHNQADQVHKKLIVGVRQLEALKARVAAWMRVTEPKTGSGGQSTHEKVKARSGTSAKKAADELSVGESLGTNKALGTAAGTGEISVEHAALIAEAADGDPGITEALIKIAASGDLVALKHACLRHKAARGNPQQKQAAERRNRFGSWKIGDDGIAQLLARGHLGDFVEMFKILDAETEAVFRTARQHGARESQGAYRHDAIRNLLEGRPSGTYGPDASGTTYHPTTNTVPADDHPSEDTPPSRGTDPSGNHPTENDSSTFGTKPSTSSQGSSPSTLLAPSLFDDDPAAAATPADDVDLVPAAAAPGAEESPVCTDCGGPVAKPTAPAQPAKAKKRNEMSVLIDLGAMRRGYPTGEETCEIPGIGVVPVEVAHRIADDALISLVLKDGKDLKQMYRFPRGIPVHLRQAFGLRDKHCSVPLCSNTMRLEIDHTMIDYADDGPLALWSSNGLCQKHHHHKTRMRYQLGGPPGHRGWYDHDGQLIIGDPGHDPDRHNPTVWTPRHALAHHLGIAEPDLTETIVATHHGWTVHQLQHHPLAQHLHLQTCQCDEPQAAPSAGGP